MADADSAATAAAPPVSFDFGKKKKKKPSSKKNAEATATGAASLTADGASPSGATAKADAKVAAQKTEGGGEQPELVDPAMELANGRPSDYTYDELHTRVFQIIEAARPTEKVVYKMKPPVVYREGTKKTVWVNFPEICRIMHRSTDHVLAFVLAELGTFGSLDGNQRLVLKGRFQPKHIESLLRRYINEYVKCHTCKSPETILKKENRLLFVECDKCKSVRAVAGIKEGFKVTTRAGRRAARA